jgi:hypothetical protein
MRQNGILDFKKPTIITAQQYGTKVSVELEHSDTDFDEVMDAFQTLTVGLGYHESAWKNWIIDRADEYRETDTEELKQKLEAWKFEEDDAVDVVFHRNIKLTEEQIDKAIAEHNAHEEGFDIDSNDGGFDGKPNKTLKLAAKEFKKVTKKNKKK